jgi:hypothetical protein
MYAAANPDVAKAAETAVNLGQDDVLTFTRLAAGEESTMSALEDGILAEPYFGRINPHRYNDAAQ